MCRKRVPDGRCRNWKTPSAELSSGPRNQHVAAFGRTEVCPTTDVRRRADVLEVCWTSATDTVEGGSSNLISYPLTHWQPVEHVAEDWSDKLEWRTDKPLYDGVLLVDKKNSVAARGDAYNRVISRQRRTQLVADCWQRVWRTYTHAH